MEASLYPSWLFVSSYDVDVCVTVVLLVDSEEREIDGDCDGASAGRRSRLDNNVKSVG